MYSKAGVMAHPGNYLDVETDNTIHSLRNMSNVYLELTTNWGFPGGGGFDKRGTGRSGCKGLRKMD